MRAVFSLWEHLFRVVLVLLAAFVLFVNFIVADGERPAPDNPQSVSIPQYPKPEELQLAEVIAIVDSQAIDVQMDQRTFRIRYFGAYLSEEKADCESQAAIRGKALLEGAKVRLLTPAGESTEGSEVRRYVFNEQGLSIEGQLINDGMLMAVENGGQYEDEFLALERRSARQGTGCLWGR